MQEGIGKLPVVGGALGTTSSVIEQLGSSTNILNSAKSYEQMTTGTDIKQMADNYKLNTIRVTHEEGGESSLDYYVFEGIGDSENMKTTRQIIDNLNENLSPGGDYEEYAKDIGYDPANPITLKDVLRSSKKVIDLHNEWLSKSGKKQLGSGGLYE